MWGVFLSSACDETARSRRDRTGTRADPWLSPIREFAEAGQDHPRGGARQGCPRRGYHGRDQHLAHIVGPAGVAASCRVTVLIGDGVGTTTLPSRQLEGLPTRRHQLGPERTLDKFSEAGESARSLTIATLSACASCTSSSATPASESSCFATWARSLVRSCRNAPNVPGFSNPVSEYVRESLR